MAIRRNRRQVALAYPVSVPWMAMFVRGVNAYAEKRGGWSLTASPPALVWAGEQAIALQGLRGWPGDGVIGVPLDLDESPVLDGDQEAAGVVAVPGAYGLHGSRCHP